MVIGGLQKFSLLDYPNIVSAVIFTQGCNFRCRYCYNPMLVWPAGPEKSSGRRKAEKRLKPGEFINTSEEKEEKVEKEEKGHSFISENGLFAFLQSRIGKLDGVVITGGEPTRQQDLPEFMTKIKKMGFKIKLDTNGSAPEMLKKIISLGLADYLAMDIKSSWENYAKTTGVRSDLKKIKESIIIIKKSQINYEFRTTLVPGLVDIKDIEKIGCFVKGAEKWYLQMVKTDRATVDKNFKKTKPYAKKYLLNILKVAKKYALICELR